MPIKLPKGFPRRKSSGNALEEVPNPPQPPQPSFRVFERPTSRGKSFDGGHNLKRVSQGRPLSAGLYVNDGGHENDQPRVVTSFADRGSGGTQDSASSGGLYDTSSSSARYSSSSTLPSSSSLDNYADDSSHAHPFAKPLPLLPPPTAQPGIYHRATDRTSFMDRKETQVKEPHQAARCSKDPISTPQPNAFYATLPDLGRVGRPRAMTETSGSTATPPKLLDTDLDFGPAGDLDDFGNMFEGFDSETKQISRSPENASPMGNSSRPDQLGSGLATNPYLSNRSPYTPPPPLHMDRARKILASPYTDDSRTSLDRLMAPSPSEEQGSYGYTDSFEPTDRQRIIALRKTPSPSVPSPTHQVRQPLLGSSLRRDSTYDMYRRSTPIEDSDALLVREPAFANGGADSRTTPYEIKPSQPSNHTSPVSGLPPPEIGKTTYPNIQRKVTRKPVSPQDSQRQAVTSDVNGKASHYLSQSNPSVSQGTDPKPAVNGDALLDDPSFRELASSAERYQSGSSSPPRKPMKGKVMTPAQFERYRKEQELSRSKSNASTSDNSEDSEKDEDDEEERARRLITQRRKQEAHLSVYRQQMMKVTGEQPSTAAASVNLRPGIPRFTMSSPNLATRMSTISLGTDRTATKGKESDDEDEDVPLGILAAHGFPSKHKSPSQFGRPESTIRYTSETYPPPPSAPAGSVAGGGPRAALPPFARNLPKDPYFGASIVNVSNRESLAFGNSGASSVYGGSQANSIHPGGLVGVIASEERSRALRRGSPNAGGGNYGLPGSGLPLPPNMPMVSPADQAQLQMSQQMSQMMQMQMQWMQQMQQMVAMQGLQPGQPPSPSQLLPMPPMMQPGFLSPAGLQVPQIQMQRPTSMGAQPPPNFQLHAPQQQQQRARSMLNPDTASQWAPRGANRISMGPGLQSDLVSGALGPGPGYAPSIAPSERSNVGMPSRYRPVSIAPSEGSLKNKSRASTLSSATALKGWEAHANMNGFASGSAGQERPGSCVVHGQGVRAVGAADEDEEAGWEEMRRKRDQKRGAGRSRKSAVGEALVGMFYPGT